MAGSGSTRGLYWLLTMELVLVLSCLIVGVIVGAVIERLCRQMHPYARVRNIIVKLAVAYASVTFIIGTGPSSHEGETDEVEIWAILSKVMRVLTFAAGTIVGAALQPVGLTGGIATGKSTVSKLLQDPHSNAADDIQTKTEFIIIDLDKIAHDILLPKELVQNDSVYDRLVAEFGDDILSKNEGENCSIPTIDRRKLGDLVFADRQKRRRLNSITHPKIISIMLKRILIEGLRLSRPKSDAKLRVVCVDIPLLYEGGLKMRLLFGNVIVVACNPKLQLERLRLRNPDLTLEQCQQRIASQIPIEDKVRKAHVILRNDGSLKSLHHQVRQVKIQLSDIVAGSQRGVELYWLIFGFAGLRIMHSITTS
ncbi:hypothetical protein ACHAWU_009778 [Discostella pseudostelligera]|uniref:Dephospho-CoA kinase n=1 Tax=Discostella pseudostelligera TaxID=259834 RepID=A0ABD3M6H5_9STRA